MSMPLIGGVGMALTGETTEALADLEWVLDPATRSDLAPELALHAAPGSLTRPARAPDQVAQHVEFWTAEGTQTLCTLSRHVALVGAGRAVLDPGADGALGLHTLLFPVLSLMFAARAACVVHAAAFVDRSWGGAVLALGGSGQGKSTLITAALSSGQPVLSDDLVIARIEQSGALAVCGVPQRLALPGDVTQDGPTIQGDRRGRRQPTLAVRLDPDWHDVRCVVMVGHSDRTEGHLRPAEQRAVFHEFLNSTVEGLMPGTARHAFPFAAAAGRLPGWRLGHARDPSARIAAARRWLALARTGVVTGQ
jgi:hypothetical protein